MFVEALPRLRAERQLAAIEASIVPHLKSDAAKRVMDRHANAAKPPDERKSASMALLDGFREAGFAVIHE